MNDYGVTNATTQSAAAASGSGAAGGTAGAILMVILVIVCLVLYVYMAYSLYVMAKKTNLPDAWMAWIPIVQTYTLIKVAGKPGWWFFLLLIPFVNIIFVFVIWYNAALRLAKPGWLGILVAILPFLIGLLAFGDNGMAQTPMDFQPPTNPQSPASPLM